MGYTDRVFSTPTDCLPSAGEVFSGQYALPKGTHFRGTPTVMDIGANVGAFTIWARYTWEGCPVFAYEPQADIFKHLYANTLGLPDVVAIQAAVGDPANDTMRLGLHNRLTTSFYHLGEQSANEVQTHVIAPEVLPPADILKIDAEGSEAYIVEHLPRLPVILMLEWHGFENRYRVEKHLHPSMDLIKTKDLSYVTGIQIWLKK
jgi:FkbM family methyltransferase